jgi:hypothetical protein
MSELVGSVVGETPSAPPIRLGLLAGGQGKTPHPGLAAETLAM